MATRSKEQCRALKPYAGVLRDYCNRGDEICAVSEPPVDLGPHLTYLEEFSEDIVKFVVDTVNEGPKDGGIFTPVTTGAAKLTEHYWITGAMFFAVLSSWGIILFFTSMRQKIAHRSL